MKDRLISAIIMIIIAIPLIVYGGIWFYFGVGVLASLAYKEIISLKWFDNVPDLIKVFGALFYLAVMYFGSGQYVLWFFAPTVFVSGYKLKDGLLLGCLSVFVAYCFRGLMISRDEVYLFIYLISIPVVSDVFAYLTGRLIGKHKLIASVSPNKTVEGAIGGFLVSCVVALGIYSYYVGSVGYEIIFYTVLLSVSSQFGDLFFSKLKRDNEIKDFSNLIKGHGGILDRFDSILFVSFIYLMFSSII